MNAIVRRGDSGPAVAQITGLLHRIGLLGDAAVPSLDDGAGPSATYDDQVELAVRTFQDRKSVV